MNQQTILIQAVSAAPNVEYATVSQTLNCELSKASLVCILGQHSHVLNNYLTMLAGISDPYVGTINYADNLLNKKTNNDILAMAYIYHNSTLLSTLNGIDNVKAPALYHHLGSMDEIDKAADILLAELDYEADHGLLPAFMDTFQKRHLLIARSILLKPRVLFIENPFGDFDREQVRVFGKYIANLVKQKNITVVTSNANFDFVQSYADQIIYLSATEIHVFKQWEDFSCYIDTTSV